MPQDRTETRTLAPAPDLLLLAPGAAVALAAIVGVIWALLGMGERKR